MVSYKTATSSDSVGIAEVKTIVWPDETADEDHIAAVIARKDHVTHIAIDDGRIVGFVDGFLTVSPFGEKRWEVDLLVVHPKYQNQGIAKTLIDQNVISGMERESKLSRALIRVGNVSSMRAFSTCKFKMQDGIYGLYVSSQSADRPQNFDKFTKYLIPVQTFGYKGVWLERKLTEDTLQAANYKRQLDDLDVAGVIIPIAQVGVVRIASAMGYSLIGQYNWWHLDS